MSEIYGTTTAQLSAAAWVEDDQLSYNHVRMRHVRLLELYYSHICLLLILFKRLGF